MVLESVRTEVVAEAAREAADLEREAVRAAALFFGLLAADDRLADRPGAEVAERFRGECPRRRPDDRQRGGLVVALPSASAARIRPPSTAGATPFPE